MLRLFGLMVSMLILVPALERSKPVEKIPELVKSINAYRAQHGLQAMKFSPELQKAAERHANDMSRHNSLSHTGTDGSSFVTRARDAGFHMSGGGGEIVAGGSASEAVRMWSQSPGHNAQMLGNCQYVGACGVGDYSCAVFGNK